MKLLTITFLATVFCFVLSFTAFGNFASAQIEDGIRATCPSGVCPGEADPENKLNNIVGTIIDFFSWLIGIASVIMIMVGGFKYVTSGGDSSKTKTAKDTILYAIIGLIIVVLAQSIVWFVINRVG
ncbi:MAG: pilin [Patescibacteria group bacterium]|jgi:hypothetical protein|nr:pilin [Patescibacteria group bacterium]